MSELEQVSSVVVILDNPKITSNRCVCKHFGYCKCHGSYVVCCDSWKKGRFDQSARFILLIRFFLLSFLLLFILECTACECVCGIFLTFYVSFFAFRLQFLRHTAMCYVLHVYISCITDTPCLYVYWIDAHREKETMTDYKCKLMCSLRANNVHWKSTVRRNVRKSGWNIN